MALPLPFGDAFQLALRAGGHAGASELRKVRDRAPPPAPGGAPRTHPLARFPTGTGGLRVALPPRWRPRSAQTKR
eukprot:3818145-Prymnesium_polylepis.1